MRVFLFFLYVLVLTGAKAPNSRRFFPCPSSVQRQAQDITAAAFMSLIPFTASAIVSAASTSSSSPSSLFYLENPYLKPDDILPYIDRNSKDGDVSSVIEAMNTFTKYYPMYALSTLKAKVLEDTIKEKKPAKILEIGTFFGFSALHICRSMPSQSKLICIEGNENNARIANTIITKAFKGKGDILDRVKVVVGLSNVVLDSNDFKKTVGKEKFDLVFLDHDKDCYLPDLQRLESKNLLNQEKCTLVADNVVFPGAPDYLRYVNADENKGWTTTLKRMPFERKGYETKFKEVEDAMSISIRTSDFIKSNVIQ